MDDDVLLYETLLEDLIRSMQQHSTAFMATGALAQTVLHMIAAGT